MPLTNVHSNYRPIITSLVEKLKDESHGKHFTYSELNAMAGINVQEHRTIILSVAKKLLKYDKVLDNIFGIGYKILEHKETAGYSTKKIKQSYRKLKKGERALNTVDISILSPGEMDHFVRAQGKISILITFNKALESRQLKNIEANLLVVPTDAQFLNLIIRHDN